MKPGEVQNMAGFDIRFMGVRERRGPNYSEKVGSFDLSRKGSNIVRLEASKRAYVAQRMPTTETAIYRAWTGDLYLALGDELKDGKYTVRIFFNPFVRFIWGGWLLMALGGLVSLTDRRLRVGAPRRARGRGKGKAIASPAE
jgi:cytochrome c-type biogenesis protein CcmF